MHRPPQGGLQAWVLGRVLPIVVLVVAAVVVARVDSCTRLEELEVVVRP
jgi:hypothetical protein